MKTRSFQSLRVLQLLLACTALALCLPACKRATCIGPGNHDCPTPPSVIGIETTALGQRLRLPDDAFSALLNRYPQLQRLSDQACVSSDTELMESLTHELGQPDIVALTFQWPGEETCSGTREIRVEAQRMNDTGLYAVHTFSYPTITQTSTGLPGVMNQD